MLANIMPTRINATTPPWNGTPACQATTAPRQQGSSTVMVYRAREALIHRATFFQKPRMGNTVAHGIVAVKTGVVGCAMPGAVTSFLRRNWFLLGMLAAILLGLLAPEAGRRINPGSATRLALIAALFLIAGLTLPSESIGAGLASWRAPPAGA